jgi:hypothetical protein
MSRHCAACAAEVVGHWRTCPLCHTALAPEGSGQTGAGEEPYPAAPLRFNRRQLRNLLIFLSVLAVMISFGAQLLIPNLMAPVRTVWLSVATLWLVVLAAAHRRRNVGSLVVWLVLLLSLAAAAWDLVTGGGVSWATTWAIPAICTFANLALGIVIWVVRLEPGEHIVKTALVLLFGLVPGLFVIFGWVTVALPALVCVAFSLSLIAVMTVLRRRELGDSLHRRLQI